MRVNINNRRDSCQMNSPQLNSPIRRAIRLAIYLGHRWQPAAAAAAFVVIAFVVGVAVVAVAGVAYVAIVTPTIVPGAVASLLRGVVWTLLLLSMPFCKLKMPASTKRKRIVRKYFSTGNFRHIFL